MREGQRAIEDFRDREPAFVLVTLLLVVVFVIAPGMKENGGNSCTRRRAALLDAHEGHVQIARGIARGRSQYAGRGRIGALERSE